MMAIAMNEQYWIPACAGMTMERVVGFCGLVLAENYFN
jgi:hypothetical protein